MKDNRDLLYLCGVVENKILGIIIFFLQRSRRETSSRFVGYGPQCTVAPCNDNEDDDDDYYY